MQPFVALGWLWVMARSVVCGPDYYLLNEISLDDVRKSVIQENTIYTTTVNDGQGYTNGFYIGNLNSLINVLKRYEIITDLLPSQYDYEYLLKQSFICWLVIFLNVRFCITVGDFIF